MDLNIFFDFQVIGKYVDFKVLALVFAISSLPFIILMLIIPESPVYLVSRQKMEEAQKQLRRLRGRNWDVVKDTLEIKKSIQGGGSCHKKTSLIHEIFKPHVLKPLIVSIMLFFFFQMSGINLMMIYAPTIFAEVTNIDKFTATILLGAALFISNVITLLIAGRCPRRILLLISSLGCSVTLTVMGLSYKVS